MLDNIKELELKKFATRIRIECLKSIASIGVGHVGGALSIADVLAVLYGAVLKFKADDPTWEERDYFVLSKGHAGPALYATLALKGYFPMEMLGTLNKPGTNLPSHADRLKTPGVDMSTGSLGQGASSAAGIAMGIKLKNLPNRVYVIVGDGECNEGQVWEMALFAHHYKLDNLILFVDANKQQIDGFTKDVLDLGELDKKFSEFGWFTQSVDGHNVQEIYAAIESAKLIKGKPSAIILNTTKGQGVSIWAGIKNNHNVTISPQQLDLALEELMKAEQDLDRVDAEKRTGTSN